MKVHATPWLWAAGGAVGLFLVDLASRLTLVGWAAGVAYLTVSTLLLALGLHRRRATDFGPANAVTATRSALVGLATALVAASLVRPVLTPLLVAIVACALLLDGVDGFVARRTGTATPLGARFDMEVDAFLLLVLGVGVTPRLGGWVLAIGLMRYAFMAAGRVLPWMNAPLPPRYWRKVVAAANGVALAVALIPPVPVWIAAIAVAAALGLLVESFGRDVVWLVRARLRAHPAERAPRGSRTAAPAHGITPPRAPARPRS